MREQRGRLGSQSPYGTGRATPQRGLIARVVTEMPGAFTVEELAVRVRQTDATVGVATVYRAVSSLEESGWIERVGGRSGSSLYAHCSAEDHHHHLVCTGCGHTEPAGCPLDDGLHAAAERSGFLLTGHDIVLYGLCSDCRPSGQREGS